jgi:hypothetical protein
MGRLIRFAIAVAILYAAWQSGSAFLQYYRFKDSVDELARFGVERDEAALRSDVIEIGRRLEIPLDPARIDVRKEGDHLYIDAGYTRIIPLLPRVRYPWSFSVHAHGYAFVGARIPGR